MPRPWAAACRVLMLAWLPTPTPLTLPTLLLLPTPTTMLLLLLMPLLLLLLPSCDAGLLFKHASVPQVVSSVKAEYPPVGNYHFNAYLSLIEKARRVQEPLPYDCSCGRYALL